MIIELIIVYLMIMNKKKLSSIDYSIQKKITNTNDTYILYIYTNIYFVNPLTDIEAYLIILYKIFTSVSYYFK